MGAPGTMLVVGSTGFAGRHLVEAARGAGFDVIAAARRPGEGDVVCDLTDAASVAGAVRTAAPDAIANLAGLSSVSRSLEAPAEAFEVNHAGTVRLLEAVAEHAPAAALLCVSSGDIYGAVPDSELPAREDREPDPLSPYAKSKVAMEDACREFRESNGLAVITARAFNHTGPGQADAFVASSFARQIAEAERSGSREAVLRTGNLELSRDFSDVRDVVRAYLTLLEGHLAGTFNVCSGRAVVLGELLEELAQHSTVAVRTEVDEGRLREADVPVLYGSAERLREQTAWEPRIPLADTLGDLLGWWRERLSA